MEMQGLKIASVTNPLDPGYRHVILMRISKGKECPAEEVRVDFHRQHT